MIFAVFNPSPMDKIQFLPRDAMLSVVYAVVVCLSVCLSVCVCVCVCVSVTLQYCIKTDKRRIMKKYRHDIWCNIQIQIRIYLPAQNENLYFTRIISGSKQR